MTVQPICITCGRAGHAAALCQEDRPPVRAIGAEFVPIGIAATGRRVALSHEDARARWHGLSCAAVGLLDRIQRAMREHELTGEVHMGGVDEALDVVAEWAAGVRDA